jgi:hypothetical protein
MATIPRPPFVAFTITPEFTRDKDAIKHFVFHTTEGTGTIEDLAHYFQTTLHPSSSGGTYREGVMYISQPNGRDRVERRLDERVLPRPGSQH